MSTPPLTPAPAEPISPSSAAANPSDAAAEPSSSEDAPLPSPALSIHTPEKGAVWGLSRPAWGWLMLAMLVYFAQASLYLNWFVDDAAISFTYARHLGTGEGLVLTPGGERIEAYSNPLWVFLLAPYASLGISLFSAAKTLSLLLGALTLLGVMRLGIRLSPQHPEKVGGLAALLTALHPPFVIWTQSGLEGPLYAVLLVFGLERTLAELEQRLPSPETRSPQQAHSTFSSAALLLVGATLTRPEGLMYVLVAWGVRWLGISLRYLEKAPQERRGVLPHILGQEAAAVGLFVLPLSLYHVWHASYFATWLTNTYYVKRPALPLGERLLNLSSPGWNYVKSWIRLYELSYTLPVIGVGLLTLRRLSTPQGIARLGVLGFTGAATFFALYADGDWMRAHRFMAPVAPFFFLLVTAGLETLLGSIQQLLKQTEPHPVLFGLGWGGLALSAGIPAVQDGLTQHQTPEVGVADVRARADFFREAREKLGLEGPVTFLDPDLGATSFYSGMKVVDTWGLGDIAFARHGTNQAFPIDYVLEEVKPDFAHIFGYWNAQTHLLDDARWSSYYVGLPSYAMRRGGMDGGNYVLRSHLRGSPKDFVGMEPLRRYAGGLELVFVGLESSIVRPGQTVVMRLLWRVTQPFSQEITLLTRFSGEGLPLLNLDHAPIYGWLPPAQWLPGEVLQERLLVTLPSQGEGTYTLEVGVMEVRSGQALQEVSPTLRPLPTLTLHATRAREWATGMLDQVRQQLEQKQGEKAFQLMKPLLTILEDDPTAASLALDAEEQWMQQELEVAQRLMKEATARQAAETLAPHHHRWRHHAQWQAVCTSLATEAFKRGTQLEAEGKLQEAFDHFRSAVRLQPSRADARLRAEALRMKRDVSGLPSPPVDNARWIQGVVLGTGPNGALTETRQQLRLGEPVRAQIYWSNPAAHRTEWRWYDAQQTMRFKQWQSTGYNAGTSFAFVSPPTVGAWTLEVWVDGQVVAVRTFEVLPS